MSTQELPRRFTPFTQRGNLVLGGLTVAFVAIAIVLFWLSSTTDVAWQFSLYLIAGIFACFPLPMLSYRLLALNRSSYTMDRNTIVLHWGLRTELLPISQVEWIRPVADLASDLPLPKIPLPGALIGIKTIDGLGKVEFMADSIEDALLIAMPESVFVISPSDPRGFQALFHRFIEMGSLETVKAESVLPSFILGKVWDDSLARALIISSFILELIIVSWVILLVTSKPLVLFGNPLDVANQPVPTIRVVVFPILGAFIFLMDLIGGSFFFRTKTQLYASYLLWGGSVFTLILLVISLARIALIS